ncbi:MAG: UDP-3-O-(3-hydroxymyristoyl)glucosamine N-acyltransferase [Thiotrichaceae bacterium]|nr:UDP-3-O-(3-hydroxymyristoyl)glucosamine N-acyltransferase [Thiotrichaceae bacterium]
MPTQHQPRTYTTVARLAKELELEFKGEGELQIASVSTFTSAKKTDLCFLRSTRYIEQLKQSQCGAVIVPVDFNETVADKTFLYSSNPDLSFIEIINYLDLYTGNSASGVHPSAIIASSARLGDNVSIGANCVIGERVELGNNVKISAACTIEDDVSIGENSTFLPNVTVCFNVKIGKDVILQPGVVIGSDGFGLVYNKGVWVKIPHLGSVEVGDRVEIGANTTVDRGALDDTIIEQGVKIDNQIQVGHNCFIGENTVIAGCTGIAGSSTIGKNCRIGGAVSICGHLSIADDVTVTATPTVTKDIPQRGTYSSGTPLLENKLWHRNNVRYKSLDKLAKTVSNLEKQ